MDIRSDNFLAVATTEKDFQNIVSKIEEKTSWQTTSIAGMSLIPLHNEPLFASEYAEETGIKEAELILDAMESTGVILMAKGYSAPVREQAIKSLLDRAKIGGQSLFKVSRKDFADIVNTCLKVQSDDCQIVSVADKISAVLSDNYVPIAATEIFSAVAEKLRRQFPKGEFVGGYINHSLFGATYALNDEDLLNVYRNQFPDLHDWDVNPILTVVTSNTGASGVNIYPKFQRGQTEFIIGSPLSMEHRGDASIDKFKENLDITYSIFTKAIKDFSKLRSVIIHHPIATFLNIAKRIGLPKNYATMAASDFAVFLDTNYSNAHDIYFGLTESLFYAENDGRDKIFLANMQEVLARALNLNWKDYDVSSSEWRLDNQAA